MRSTGITSSEASWPDPAGSRSRYFSPSRLSTSIDARLYITGGGTRIPGLSRVLADRLRIPVQMANPLERLQVAEGVFDAMEIDQVAPLLMLPIGLALRTAA